MVKSAKLQKVGNSLAVLLDEKMLSVIGANPDSTFRISIQDQRIILEMASPTDESELVLKSAKKVMETQRRVFKKLAE